ncbi:MAG: hypothetical protein HWN65_14485 [Candidatus Helarchaeota archaeon]|nr:hypothetical protein [Candidatus Helarchaeota archaeon]
MTYVIAFPDGIRVGHPCGAHKVSKQKKRGMNESNLTILRGALNFFADGLPDEFRDRGEPLILVIVDVLLDAFDQWDR